MIKTTYEIHYNANKHTYNDSLQVFHIQGKMFEI